MEKAEWAERLNVLRAELKQLEEEVRARKAALTSLPEEARQLAS